MEIIRHLVLIVLVVAAVFYLTIEERPIRMLNEKFDQLFSETSPPKVDRVVSEQEKQRKEDYWKLHYQPSEACLKPATAVLEIECKNKRDIERANFEREWERATQGRRAD